MSTRCRSDNVAEADVDLHGDLSIAQSAAKFRTHAVVVGILGDGFGGDAAGVKDQPVGIDVLPADIGDHRANRSQVVTDLAEEVDVARRPGDRGFPYQERQRPLEDKPVGIR